MKGEEKMWPKLKGMKRCGDSGNKQTNVLDDKQPQKQLF